MLSLHLIILFGNKDTILPTPANRYAGDRTYSALLLGFTVGALLTQIHLI